MPVIAPDDVGPPSTLRLRPLLHLCDRGAQDLVLDRLAVAVQLLEPVGEPASLLAVGREEQLERRARVTEPAGRVDPRCQPETDLAGVDRRRIDARDAHQRLQSRLLRARERA